MFFKNEIYQNVKFEEKKHQTTCMARLYKITSEAFTSGKRSMTRRLKCFKQYGLS